MRTQRGCFPLTPPLSLWERENGRQSIDEAKALLKIKTRAALSPLPKAEGRGEGERGGRQPRAPGIANAHPTRRSPVCPG